MVGVLSSNERARRCYAALGFGEIGRRREARLIAGKAYDAVYMDLLAREFQGSAVASIVERSQSQGVLPRQACSLRLRSRSFGPPRPCHASPTLSRLERPP